MKQLRLLTILIVAVFGIACAKPPPPVEPIVIPVQLVNIQDSLVGITPDRPDSASIKSIRKGDKSKEAILIVLEYLVNLKKYVVTLESQLATSTNEQADLRQRIKAIKRFIVMQQNQLNQP